MGNITCTALAFTLSNQDSPIFIPCPLSLKKLSMQALLLFLQLWLSFDQKFGLALYVRPFFSIFTHSSALSLSWGSL